MTMCNVKGVASTPTENYHPTLHLISAFKVLLAHCFDFWAALNHRPKVFKETDIFLCSSCEFKLRNSKEWNELCTCIHFVGRQSKSNEILMCKLEKVC